MSKHDREMLKASPNKHLVISRELHKYILYKRRQLGFKNADEYLRHRLEFEETDSPKNGCKEAEYP